MTPKEALKTLDEMDSQTIHAKRRVFHEIAQVIRNLISEPPPNGMELVRTEILDGKQVECYREVKSDKFV